MSEENAVDRPVVKARSMKPKTGVVKLKDAIYHKAAEAIRKWRAARDLDGPQTKEELRVRVRTPFQLHEDDRAVYDEVLEHLLERYNPPEKVREELPAKMLRYVLEPPDGTKRKQSSRIHHSHVALLKPFQPLSGSTLLLVFKGAGLPNLPSADHILDVQSVWPGFADLDSRKQRLVARVMGVRCSTGSPIPSSLEEAVRLSDDLEKSLGMFFSIGELASAPDFCKRFPTSLDTVGRRFWLEESDGTQVSFALFLQSRKDVDMFRKTVATLVIDPPPKLGLYRTISIALGCESNLFCYSIMSDPVQLATKIFGDDVDKTKTARHVSAVDFPESGAAVVFMHRAPCAADVRSCLFWFAHFAPKYARPAMALVYPKSSAPFGMGDAECNEQYLGELRVVTDTLTKPAAKQDRDDDAAAENKEKERDRDRAMKAETSDSALTVALVGAFEGKDATWVLFESK